jgi:ferric-dicitrate binding protein FerR (iron transport regulator)
VPTQRYSFVGLLVCLAALSMVIGTGRRDDSQTISAGSRAITTVRLPDGSRARLMDGATIRFRRDFPQRRRLWLYGQATFDVVPGRLLSLWTENALVSTRTGSFAVRASGRETTFVSMRTGVARLRALNEDMDPAYRPVTIASGQHAFAARMVGAKVTPP